MLTDIQLRYINSSLVRLDLKEIEEKMHISHLEEQLKNEGYVYSSIEQKYVKQVEKKDVEQCELDYKKLIEMEATESFNYRIDPIVKATWEALLTTDKLKKIPKGKILSLALLDFIEKYK